MTATHWALRGTRMELDRPRLMGIVNVTPDSFSDGGRYLEPEDAVAHAVRLESEGAAILDIGGESTRPGSQPVDPTEEARRVVPVIETLADTCRVPISIDTRRAAVARQAVDAGASIINDVSALGDPQMARVAAEARAGLVLMHMQGQPATMQQAPEYDDVMDDVLTFLRRRVRRAVGAGVRDDSVAIDPGIGFGKRTGHGHEDNVDLIRGVPRLVAMGHPVLVGASRKTFLGNLVGGAPADQRVAASVSAAVEAARLGAHVLRVHDVKATHDALAVARAVWAGQAPE